MNEQIRECWLKAAREDSDDKWDTQEEFIERFARLIVGECVTTLEQHHPFTKDPEAYLYAISLIKEHFGVAE